MQGGLCSYGAAAGGALGFRAEIWALGLLVSLEINAVS